MLVGRTFSKAYGLAGLRVGVLMGQAQALEPVRAVTLPFNNNGGLFLSDENGPIDTPAPGFVITDIRPGAAVISSPNSRSAAIEFCEIGIITSATIGILMTACSSHRCTGTVCVSCHE